MSTRRNLKSTIRQKVLDQARRFSPAMFQRTPPFLNLTYIASLLFLTLIIIDQCTGIWPWSSALGELSHFHGRIAQNDILCAHRVIGKGTTLPASIYFATPLSITAYLAEASKFHKEGFTLGINNGGLQMNSVGLVIGGSGPILPYAVEVSIYCAVPVDPAPEVPVQQSIL
ncbi:uncharacterized protein LOC134209036 [Armigeres subalbatus]|uniref:uncharacterized protein LOC134209036 n=1 Tax=Armigeres subalbatus TaxID=124917 RepID=UPI002ED0C3F8